MARVSEQQVTYYEAMGGHAFFDDLVAEFYRGVAGDTELRAMYPEEDLAPAQARLMLFLEQYWGGPTTYSERRGHPRLRARHMPYKVNPLARDRWIAHMTAAVRSAGLSPMHEAEMLDYVERAAHSMLNTFDD